MSLLINGLFAQSLRYAQKIILGISNICLWLFFSHAPPGRRLDLEQKSSLINRLMDYIYLEGPVIAVKEFKLYFS